jgi:hypothetical protein
MPWRSAQAVFVMRWSQQPTGRSVASAWLRFALPQDTYGAFDPAIGTQATDNGPAIH